MNAEYVTLDKKTDLADVIEQGLERHTQYMQGPWAGRLEEDVTMKQIRGGRLKNCAPSAEDVQVAT